MIFIFLMVVKVKAEAYKDSGICGICKRKSKVSNFFAAANLLSPLFPKLSFSCKFWEYEFK
jgi:hypothetical protein